MFKKFYSFLKEKLFTINDTPHKVALGFGLGVFSGLLPGTGPLAALFFAFVFRANRAAALAGGILTNTWMSLVVFTVAVQVGAMLTGIKWQELYQQGKQMAQTFHWKDMFSAPVLAVVKPLFIGYLVTGILLALLTYILVLVVMLERQKRKNARSASKG